MVGSKDRHVHELVDAYALDALDPDERQMVEEHVLACSACAAGVARARHVATLLASAGEQLEPAEGHLERFKARVAAERHPQNDRSPSDVARAPKRFEWRPRRLLALAAAALLVMGLGAWNVQLRQELAFQQEVAGIATHAESRDLTPSQAVAGARGRAFVDRSSDQILVSVSQLPQVATDQTYQLWFTRPDGGLDSGGTFRNSADGGLILATAPAGLGAYVGVGITPEPGGGSSAPTGPMLMYWTLSD